MGDRNRQGAAALSDGPATLGRPAEGPSMLAILALVFLVLWLGGFLAFHIAGAAIHVLLLIALVLLVLHFVRGRRAV